MSLGLIIVLIVIFGYTSNWLNWRYLNHRFTQYLYYVGAFVHESSHALLCMITGAKILEFKVFTSQPHVIHNKSKLPLIGEFLISSAPIVGGLFFLFLVNHFLLKDHFTLMTPGSNWKDVLIGPLDVLSQIHILEWQTWVMVALFLNIGAMIGPSFQDIKNIWPILILAFFVRSPILEHLGLIALCLILVNILIQAGLIGLLKFYSVIRK